MNYLRPLLKERLLKTTVVYDGYQSSPFVRFWWLVWELTLGQVLKLVKALVHLLLLVLAKQ